MSRYVIYDTRTSKIVEHPRTRTRSYKSMKAAIGARTKMLNSGLLVDNDVPDEHGLISSWYGTAEYEHYCKHIEKMVTVKNLMSGKDVVQSVNTPLCCDPSSETYWCM